MLLSTASPSHAKPNVQSIALVGGEPLTQCSCQFPLSLYKWAAVRTALSPQRSRLSCNFQHGLTLHRLLFCSCQSLLLLKIPLLLLFLLYFCAKYTVIQNQHFSNTKGKLQFQNLCKHPVWMDNSYKLEAKQLLTQFAEAEIGKISKVCILVCFVTAWYMVYMVWVKPTTQNCCM